MAVIKPYYRCYRPNLRESQAAQRNRFYIRDGRNVTDTGPYIRRIEVLYKDMDTIFDYIEPDDKNENCFSIRLYELLIRLCSEFEANCKEILEKNGYPGHCEDWNIRDYWKLNKTHHLSGYSVLIPNWQGINAIRIPFSNWNITEYKPLEWYKAYNEVKHNRINNFFEANLRHVIDALCGVIVLLASEFYNEDFSKPVLSYVLGDIILSDGWQDSIGTPFRIKRPTDWSDDEKYDFDWDTIKNVDIPFQKLFSSDI